MERPETWKRFPPHRLLLVISFSLLLLLLVVLSSMAYKGSGKDGAVHIVYTQRPEGEEPEDHDIRTLSSVLGRCISFPPYPFASRSSKSKKVLGFLWLISFSSSKNLQWGCCKESPDLQLQECCEWFLCKAYSRAGLGDVKYGSLFILFSPFDLSFF